MSIRPSEPPLFRFSAEPEIPPALLLRELAVGLPALRCWPLVVGDYGPDRAGAEIALPLIDPPRVDGKPWIEAALAAVRVDGRALDPRACRLLGATLVAGERDGLPIFQPGSPLGEGERAAALAVLRPRSGATYPVEWEQREIELGDGRSATFTSSRWQRRTRAARERGLGRNLTRPLRDLLTAAVWDLGGSSAAEIGRVIHRAEPRPDFERVSDHEPGSEAWRSNVYESRRRGRSMLGQLGCWPWCLTVDGKLPRRWRRQADYAAALAEWVGAQPSSSAAA